MLSKFIYPLLSLSLITLGSSCASIQSRGQVYTFESDANGFNTKNYFYDNGEEVVAFDTQFTPELAAQSIAFLRTKTKNPITHLIITHPNPDKYNGISTFRKEGATIIASDLTEKSIPGVHEYKKYYFVKIAKMFTEETYPKLAPIDQTFAKTETLKLRNGEAIILTELGQAGVTTNQTVVQIPRANSLVVGDLIHYKAHAWLEGGIVNGKPAPSVPAWIKTLQTLPSQFSSGLKVLGGRGEVTTLKVAVAEQIQYLQKADQLVTSFVKASKPGASLNYQELQKTFEKTFPEYGLGYMIQYGAYGLAESKR